MSEDYQKLFEKHPRFALASFPSPLDRAHRLEQHLRSERVARVPRMYLKRDDLLSLGFGGNKVRNLEFIIGQALAEGATDVITAGRQQSNHCRITAAACARAALRSHLVLSGSRPAVLSGNLLLSRLLGAELHFSDSDERDARERMVDRVKMDVESKGRRPFLIPVGGSSALGALGHFLGALELAEQMTELGEHRSWGVVLATATGGTQAGMLCGLAYVSAPAPVRGFAVAKSARELHDDVRRLANVVAEEVGVASPAGEQIVIDDSMLGGGYGVETDAARDAIGLVARTEGVLADPVYTGKALAGLLAMIRGGSTAIPEAVVFLHTGGAPALFATKT